jgi:hypothetical protein
MKRSLIVPVLAFITLALGAQKESILIDFGKPALKSSADTDPNGFFWNNIASDPEAQAGVLGWELLTEAQKAAFTDPRQHYESLNYPYVIIDNLIDRSGEATGLSLSMSRYQHSDDTDAGGVGSALLEYGDGLGAIPTQTGYPASATIDSFFINWGVEADFTISGLDDAKTYTLKLWGGQARDSRLAGWKVNGGELQIIETFNNIGASDEDYAIFENVSPINGAIVITYVQGGPSTGSPGGHWSTLEITGDFSGGSNGGGTGQRTWNGFDVTPEGFVNTGVGGWLNGFVYVGATEDAGWVYVYAMAKYVYVTPAGWVYISR